MAYTSVSLAGEAQDSSKLPTDVSDGVVVASLALLGSVPRFTEVLHVGRPNLGDRQRFEERVRGIWERNWLTNDGPLVREFEASIARLLNVRQVIAVCNATIGLELVIQALGLTGEIIVPSFTFIASVHCISRLGLQPVFCDCDPETHQIDPTSAERAIGTKTRGILGVHLWGEAAPVEELQTVADRHGIPLFMDAAHAFGVGHHGRMVGSFGRAEVFSFHGTKFVNSFEGGAITTQDDELAAKLRLMRNFGFAGFDNVIHSGTNGKMSEVSAAMGLTSLESMDRFVDCNRANMTAYRQELEELPGIRFVTRSPNQESNVQYVVLEIDAASFGLSRDQLLQVLHAENILARRYFYPGCHRMPVYRDTLSALRVPLTNTERVSDRILLLPTGTAVDRSMIQRIGETIRTARELREQVRMALR